MFYIFAGCALMCVIATPKISQLYARHISKQTYQHLSTKLNYATKNMSNSIDGISFKEGMR